MKFYATNTKTLAIQEIEIPDDNLAAIGGWLAIGKCDCRLTVTHTPGKLSHFAIAHQRGEFDFEMFNDEPEAPQAVPYLLANMLQRFTPERFRRWVAQLQR